MGTNPAEAPSLSDMYHALAPVLEDFAREVGEALAAYANTGNSQPVRQLLGVGGGFQLHGLAAYLRSLQSM